VSDQLARLLANPLRDRLMFEYEREPTSPSRIARRLDASLSLISYHTNVLLQNGCLECVGTARRRGAVEHFYRAVVVAAIEDDEWERIAPAMRRTLVLRTVDVTSEEARRAALSGGFDGAQSHLSRMLVSLDEPARAEVSVLLRETVERIRGIEAAANARASAVRRQEVVMLCFERASAP
jgi:hypothetical protein